MPDHEAIKILLARRGTMYDPTIVDAFIAIHASAPRGLIADSINDSAIASSTLEQAFTGTSKQADSGYESAPQLEQIAASSEETLVLYDLASTLKSQDTLRELVDSISKHLRRLVPASAIVFYIYDSQSDDLVSVHAVGMHSSHLIGLRVPRGERLAGWVAANKQTILNADPILDLGEVARLLKPRLRSCMCAPLMRRHDVIGVVALYSVESDAFTDNHKRLLELIGRQISQPIHQAYVDESQPGTVERSTRSQAIYRLERLSTARHSSVPTEEPVSVVSITLKRRDSAHSSTIDESMISSVEESVRKALRTGDILFRYSVDQLVALLAKTDASTADLITQRIREIVQLDLSSSRHNKWRIDVAIGVATAPKDGLSVEQLVRSAQDRPISSSDGPSAPAVH
jgi:diguanylate cyclase (GGDEF)-like protein